MLIKVSFNAVTGLIIIITLILINGLFAATELALITADKHYLQRMSQYSKHAMDVLKQKEAPNTILATVQIAITFVGIVSGIIGGDVYQEKLVQLLVNFRVPINQANIIAYFLISLLITYLFILFGEIVPKRIALRFPEKISLFMIKPILYLQACFRPAIYILEKSTNLILDLLPIKNVKPRDNDLEKSLTQILIAGTKDGVFLKRESELIQNTLRVADMKIRDIMTPSSEIVWIDINDDDKTLLKKFAALSHEEIVVCDQNLSVNNVLGFVRLDNVLTNYINKGIPDVKNIIRRKQVINEEADVLSAVGIFKSTHTKLILVTNKYDKIVGIISATDVLRSISGVETL